MANLAEGNSYWAQIKEMPKQVGIGSPASPDFSPPAPNYMTARLQHVPLAAFTDPNTGYTPGQFSPIELSTETPDSLRISPPLPVHEPAPFSYLHTRIGALGINLAQIIRDQES